MEPPSSTPARSPWDRRIAVSMVALSALIASAWIMRERQWATDLAESREDLRQAMHRLKTLSSSTDQIRIAYLQRKAELDSTRKKLEQASARPSEEKSKAPATPEERAKANKIILAYAEKLSQAKLPSWVAIEKNEASIRLLPGVGLPAGNEGFAAFAGLARSLATLDSDWTLELTARAEPGTEAWETAQDRGSLLMSSAQKSLKGEPARLRLRIDVAKGPRMEWRLLPPENPAKPLPESKAAKK